MGGFFRAMVLLSFSLDYDVVGGSIHQRSHAGDLTTLARSSRQPSQFQTFACSHAAYHQLLLTVRSRPVSSSSNFDLASPGMGKVVKKISFKFWLHENQIRGSGFSAACRRTSAASGNTSVQRSQVTCRSRAPSCPCREVRQHDATSL